MPPPGGSLCGLHVSPASVWRFSTLTLAVNDDGGCLEFYFFFPGFSSQLLLHPAAQATLSSILLPAVQGYTQSTPSPPPGLAPIDKQPSGVPDCSSSCALNGHVKVAAPLGSLEFECFDET